MAPARVRVCPWDEWLDGNPWRLKKGEDYDVATVSMRAAAFRAAKAAGKSVRTRITEADGIETLVIQAYGDWQALSSDIEHDAKPKGDDAEAN